MDSKSITGLYADDHCKHHLTGPGHPECPERYDAAMRGIESAGLLDRLQRLTAGPATDAEIAACHSRAYIDLAAQEIAAGATMLSCGDTNVSAASFDIASRAAGGAIAAVDAVMQGSIRNAFCAMRPPGHHATPDCGMGFCVFNSIAIAARHAQSQHGIERVLIADWDVHHGNGTQDIFYRDASVYFFSTHQWPLYPGTGRAEESGVDEAQGTTCNCPLPPGSGRAEIVGAFEDTLRPAADRFKPELVMISAGFDSRIGDPLGQFMLSDQDFANLTRIMMKIAETHAGGRLVSVLEGGYNLDGLAAAVSAHVAALMDSDG